MIFLNFLLCSSSSIKIKEMLTMTPLCELDSFIILDFGVDVTIMRMVFPSFHEDLLGTIAQYQQEDLEQDVK